MIDLKIHSDIDASAFAVQTSAARSLIAEISEDEMAGWMKLPGEMDEVELERIKIAAEDIQERSDYLVCVGAGGSYLGIRAILEALGNQSGTRILFAGNSFSTLDLQKVLYKIGDADFSINVISKSGKTLETALAFRILKEKLIEKYGEDEASSRIYATTDAASGALRAEAEARNYECFNIPGNVGGRYSVLSAVGLLPLAVAGLDIERILAGANEEYKWIEGDAGEAICKYAALRHLLRSQGCDVEVLATFESELYYFGEWWKQLFGESEGKNDGGLFPATVNYSTDLHSLGQFLQEGRKNVFETFLKISKSYEQLENTRPDSAQIPPIRVPEETDDLDGLNYLAGETLDCINAKAYRATVKAHAKHIPIVEIIMPNISEWSMGSLVYFFEMACALSATLQGVNPFDQPGVETYKKEMLKLLHEK